MRFRILFACLIAALQLSGCGGGSNAAGGSGGSDDGGGGGGGGSSVPTSCGLSTVAGLASAGPAEGAWSGSFPILGGVDIVFGGGIVAADGQANFLIGDGELWTGSVLASPDGAVSSRLTRYFRATGAGIGGLRDPGSPNTAFLGFDAATAGSRLSGEYLGVLSSCQPVRLGYRDIYLRLASLAVIAGVFTASDDDGYTLTVTIHSDGQLDGSDTRGCVLIGDVTVPDPAKNYYRAAADVSSCGGFSGHYAGAMWLSDLEPDDNTQLNLALLNGSSAIFRRLAR